MAKIVRISKADEAARSIFGKKLVEQNKLIMSLLDKMNKMERRIEHLENVHVVEVKEQRNHERNMVRGTKDYPLKEEEHAKTS